MDGPAQLFPVAGNGMALYEDQQYRAGDHIPFIGKSGVSGTKRINRLNNEMILRQAQNEIILYLESVYKLRIMLSVIPRLDRGIQSF